MEVTLFFLICNIDIKLLVFDIIQLNYSKVNMWKQIVLVVPVNSFGKNLAYIRKWDSYVHEYVGCMAKQLTYPLFYHLTIKFVFSGNYLLINVEVWVSGLILLSTGFRNFMGQINNPCRLCEGCSCFFMRARFLVRTIMFYYIFP